MNKPEPIKTLPKWVSRFLIKFAICITLFFLSLYMKEYFPKQIEQIHACLQNDSSQGLQTKAREFILKYSPVLE